MLDNDLRSNMEDDMLNNDLRSNMGDDMFDGGYSDSTIEENDSEGDVFEIEPASRNENLALEPANENVIALVEPASRNENLALEPANENVIALIEPANRNEELVDVAQMENERPDEIVGNVNNVQIDHLPNEEVVLVVGDNVQSNLIEEEQVLEDSEEVVVVSHIKRGKRSRESDSEDELDSKNVCPICMDKWTNAGDHRLVCLKCGHLFGNRCILRWFDVGCPAGQRRCPQCNKKASKRDIRTLYVHNLQALDTAEYEKLQEEINTLKQEKAFLQREITRVNSIYKFQQEDLKTAQRRLQNLEKSLKSQPNPSSQPVAQTSTVSRMALENTLEISSVGGCRVMASALRDLYVSLSSTNNLFHGFCVRKVMIRESRPVFGQCIFLHTKAIRDLAIRPELQDLLLSVSLDKTAKVVDLSNNSVVNKFSTSNPLWSCCWDRNNLNRFFVGSQNGTVTQFDSRQPNAPLQQLEFPGDLSPVTSVVSLKFCAERPAMRHGGILVSKLVSCWAFVLSTSEGRDHYDRQQLPMEGPFTSLCYDEQSDHILVSRRPNHRDPSTCHMVCQLQQDENAITCNVVHSFEAGKSQMQLSRPCFTKVENDLLVAAYVECRSCINLWNVTSGRTVATVKAYDAVKDVCSMYCYNKLSFAALSEKTLRIYSMS